MFKAMPCFTSGIRSKTRYISICKKVLVIKIMLEINKDKTLRLIIGLE